MGAGRRGWWAAHPLRPALAALLGILILGSAAPALEPPRADRDWYPYLSHTAHVEVSDGVFAVRPVSDWSYAPEGVITEDTRAAVFALAELRRVWFVLEPQPGSQLAAHTLLLFEFEGDRLLGLTIEARRERDEDYSALRGLFNAFELAYVWGSARDFLTRRAVMLDHQVYVYPVEVTEAQELMLLARLLERTEALERAPRYYNTLLSNCTNELAKAAGLQWTPAYVFTGRSDEYLFRRGLIPGRSFAEARTRADMTEFVKALNGAPASRFDAELLQELRLRHASSLRS